MKNQLPWGLWGLVIESSRSRTALGQIIGSGLKSALPGRGLRARPVADFPPSLDAHAHCGIRRAKEEAAVQHLPQGAAVSEPPGRRGSLWAAFFQWQGDSEIAPSCGQALVEQCWKQGFDIGAGKATLVGMYEASGRIKLINETQSFPSGFTKREFVVTTANDKYPQDLKFEVVKDKCSMLDGFEVGQEVQVSFDIRGNEYNGKYFVNLSCWKIQAGSGGEAVPAAKQGSRRPGGTVAEPSASELRNEGDFDDEIPF